MFGPAEEKEQESAEIPALSEYVRYTLPQRLTIYRHYQRMKEQEGDDHGVSDAANDIRVLKERMKHDG